MMKAKQMKQLAAAVALVIFIASSPVPAQPVSKAETIEELAKAVTEAYTAKDLGRLDARRAFSGKVKIVITHSLAGDDDKDAVETRTFRTFAQAERWLRSREIDGGLPARADRPLIECKRGICSYNFDGGILHNHLYLDEISYGYRNGRPYIKTISLLDGD